MLNPPQPELATKTGSPCSQYRMVSPTLEITQGNHNVCQLVGLCPVEHHCLVLHRSMESDVPHCSELHVGGHATNA